MIISVLSFICWIHDANDFHLYISKIVMERGHWAPHLNPPLKTVYTFAAHHITYDKSELYLNDWEVRYGLWRKFRLDETDFYENVNAFDDEYIFSQDDNENVSGVQKINRFFTNRLSRLKL